jgi:hypothetical protein
VLGVLTASVLGYILPSLIFFKLNHISMADILRTLYLITSPDDDDRRPQHVHHDHQHVHYDHDVVVKAPPRGDMISSRRVPLYKPYALSILFVVFGFFTLVVGLGLQLYGAFMQQEA